MITPRVRYAAFIVGCLWCILWIGSVIAQSTNRTDPFGNGGARASHVVRGKIFLPNGRLPEIRIRVVLEVLSGGIFTETFADSVGNFEFRQLPPNTYRVVIPSDNHTYETVQESVELSGVISRTFSVQLYLRPKIRPEQTAEGRMISAAAFDQDVPKAAKKSYEQGVKKMQGGKLDDAMTQFQDAIKTFPDYVQAHNKLGECFIAKNQLDAAQVEFEKSLAINPKYPLTLIDLGMVYVQLKKYPEAIENLEAANKLDESYPMSHVYLGVALLQKTPHQPEDFEKAERSFQRALVMGGDEIAYVHKYLFNLQLRKNDYKKAIGELESYLQKQPKANDSAQVRDTIAKLKKSVAAQTTPGQK